MKCISWNVNGIRAVLNKDFVEILYALDADIFCIQETKAQPDQIEVDCELYPYQYINSAQRKGYSGTMIFCKEEPMSVRYGMNIEEHDTEGRVITLEYPEYYVVTVYTPNSGDGLKRLEYRMEWDKAFSAYLKSLDKPVMACGDFNVANEEIDIKNPKTNHKNAGFTDEERKKMTELLNAGFTDTFRYLYPTKENCYTWWSYMFNARANNAGWRIDYFIVSKSIEKEVKEAKI